MRSIRRSLIAYFLLLLALALGAVGVLVHQIAGDALRDREAISADRINKEYKDQCARADEQFNERMEDHARALARDFRHYSLVIDARVQARELDDWDNRTRLGLLALPAAGIATNWNALLTAPLAQYDRGRGPGGPGGGFRSMVYFALRRQYMNDLLQQWFVADAAEHPKYFLIQDWQRSWLIRGAGPETLPPFPESVVSQLTVGGPGRTGEAVVGAVRVRQVVVKAPVQGFLIPRMRVQETARSATYHSVAGGGIVGVPPSAFLSQTIDPLQYVIVQVARPRAELDDELASLAAHRDKALADVWTETRTALSRLRANLLLIAVLAFVALALGGWFLVGQGLAPLRNLTDAVSQVSEKDFHLPIEQKELSRELIPIHDRLTHTLDALRRAFDREKQAVADISHELRTPLAALLSTLDVALRKPREAAQYKTTLEECRDISKQLSRLVERIMTLAYLDAGNDRTRTEPIDVGDLANECVAVIRPLAEAHGLTFRAAIDPTAQLDTDPDKLREVLMNLLHNAVEYNSTNGKIELRVARGRGAVTFEVRDTGIGMSPDVRNKIFERFYRADPSRHATGVHAGLGLSIVKEYIERLGGTIAVESTVGQGSTFRVSLPATDVPDSGNDREPWPR